MAIKARNGKEKQVKRRRILDAAKEQFFQHGYQQTSINKMMKHAGESTGTFYLYFKGKRDIYRTLFTDGLDIFVIMVEDALTVCGPTSLEKLTAIARTYLQFYKRYPGYFDIMAFMVMTDNELRDRDEASNAVDQKAVSLLKIIEDVFIQGVAKKELLPTNTWQTTIAFWGVMDGIIMLEKRGNLLTMGVNHQQIFERIIASLFYGIANRPVAQPDWPTEVSRCD